MFVKVVLNVGYGLLNGLIVVFVVIERYIKEMYDVIILDFKIYFFWELKWILNVFE